MDYINKLKIIRSAAGPKLTMGLSDVTIKKFINTEADLRYAIDSAHALFNSLGEDIKNIFRLSEGSAIRAVQEGYLNFYDSDTVNPYIALSGKGPWIITAHGAVVHDSGGYGMLGFGHCNDKIMEAISRPQVMANIMTANISQKKLVDALRREIGHSRETDKEPYGKFLCLNSGSESVTVAARISDIKAKQMTDEGGKYYGRKIKFLSMKGSFHGRTERPAQASDSSAKNYKKLASFREDRLITVELNNLESLRAAFETAEKENVFIEMMFLEPVMGEGNPGVGVSREFYDESRSLTKEHGSLLLIDSIQAGLRTNGCLSICDYPGFEDCEAPDMETFSKAINGGQYPLSVLALRAEVADIYSLGLYGNTMTTNPRALDVAVATLDMVTPELRKNILDRGLEFKNKLNDIKNDFPEAVTGVTGTGLLFALHLNPDGYLVVGKEGVETYLRKKGIGVIHGGKNALRFTPHFNITSEEIDLVISEIRKALGIGKVFS